jgi:hypothetical protein
MGVPPAQTQTSPIGASFKFASRRRFRAKKYGTANISSKKSPLAVFHLPFTFFSACSKFSPFSA